MIFYCVRSNNISAPNKYAKRLGKTDVRKTIGRGHPILEIRTIRALLFYGISFPDRALHSSFIQGMSTFPSSLTYLVKQSGKHVALRLPFSRYSLPYTSRISISYATAPPSRPLCPQKKERLRTSSIPLSIRCARKFMSAPVTVLDIPFSCLY